MRCTHPRTVGFYPDGKTICWSPKKYSKQYATFQLPCGKCLSCRLEKARQTAIRCVHEASVYGDKNSFITLTYDQEHLTSERLNYDHFLAFKNRLRTHAYTLLLSKLFPSRVQEVQRRLWRELPIQRKKELLLTIQSKIFVAGEYGDKNQRPHWHAILFNWRPNDLQPKYMSDNGDQVYTSETLSMLWPYGNSELGQVTFKSAGYVARYASKKLYHGPDGSHEFEPIAKFPNQGIGKAWLEKYWKDIFLRGEMIVQNGDKFVRTGIPRYYEKWLQKHKPEEWKHYVTQVKPKITSEAAKKEALITLAEKRENFKRSALYGLQCKALITRNQTNDVILKQKFEGLKKYSKF